MDTGSRDGHADRADTAEAMWVTDDNVALLTDLYQLTMLQAYWREALYEEAVFSLFVRRLPPERGVLLAAGLGDVLVYLERLRFTPDALDWLADTGRFRDGFLRWLEAFRFEGTVRAVPEGTPVFAEEPLLEVAASLPQAQLIETVAMNLVHYQTMVASKAVRVVAAAAGRTVVDFGLRRMHGVDTGLRAARAFHIAGVDATSNVLAGRLWGVPIAGTMAHSYVQAHDDEAAAFRAFAELYPDTILLVDTYDTLDGVRAVVQLARELGPEFRVRGIRLDSGDLVALAFGARDILDRHGLAGVEIFASGGLDEHAVAEMVRRRAPIDGFGVGTSLGVSRDAPALDIAYKLTEFRGRGRLKLSPGKRVLPGPKQVFRVEVGGLAVRDIIAQADARAPGRPLLQEVMRGGERLDAGRESLETCRARARQELARLPDRLVGLGPADPPYPVVIDDDLLRAHAAAVERLG